MNYPINYLNINYPYYNYPFISANKINDFSIKVILLNNNFKILIHI